MARIVWHHLDVGEVIASRKVEESWQYESLVKFGACCMFCDGIQQWIPTIELSFTHA